MSGLLTYVPSNTDAHDSFKRLALLIVCIWSSEIERVPVAAPGADRCVMAAEGGVITDVVWW